ncbi:hypothetical protein [Labedaea rhizosphaerae]|uniref:Uncharacterized protein n=1 Tax=Labedaea rhizosphaerae TaxID=598644 RepID=A0A4R6RXS7_LABRH|nr:hypothetical protein [Labedaea rhizosphaerae]TDP91902.1 hypothetical protein EV186_108112 [Labedaea rhizosphaerae]
MREVPSYGIPCDRCGNPAVAFVPGVYVRHENSVCLLPNGSDHRGTTLDLDWRLIAKRAG